MGFLAEAEQFRRSLSGGTTNEQDNEHRAVSNPLLTLFSPYTI